MIIAAGLTALALGTLATFGLINRPDNTRTLGTDFATALPLIAVSLAGIGPKGVTLIWAVLATLAVGIGLFLSGRIHVPTNSAFATGTRLFAGLALLVGLFRWLMPIIANQSRLSQWALVVAVAAAAACLAYGRTRFGTRALLVLAIATTVVFLLLGIAVGAPALLTNPPVPVESAPLAKALWLVIVVVLGAVMPAPKEPMSAGRIGAIAAIMLLCLLGLLAIFSGSITFPAPGGYILSGFTSYGKSVVLGSAIGLIPLIAAVVGGAWMIRHTVEAAAPAREAFPLLTRWSWVPTALVAAAAVALCFVPILVSVLVAIAAIAGAVGIIVENRVVKALDSESEQESDEESQPEPEFA